MSQQPSAESDVPQNMVDAARDALTDEGFTLPYMARVADYSDPLDLRIADREADLRNDEAVRAVLRAALSTRVIPPVESRP